MKRILFTAVLVLLIASSITNAREQVDRVVLVINEEIITLTEFMNEAEKNGINMEEAGMEYKFLEQISRKPNRRESLFPTKSWILR